MTSPALTDWRPWAVAAALAVLCALAIVAFLASLRVDVTDTDHQDSQDDYETLTPEQKKIVDQQLLEIRRQFIEEEKKRLRMLRPKNKADS